MGRDAGQAGRSGAQQGSHPSPGRGARGQRPRQPRRGVRLRHRAQHAVVGQLDPSERIAADHRLVQQRRGRHRARSGQRHSGARPFAPGDRALRRRRFQHADVRVHDRRASQAAGEGGGLQQFLLRPDPRWRRSRSACPPSGKGIEFPNPDFAALARACGGQGFKADEARRACGTAIDEALSLDGPAIVDAWSRPTNCPTCRISNSEQIGNFAMAKIREAVLAVTGP